MCPLAHVNFALEIQPHTNLTTTTMRNINEIIIHCTATPEGRHVTVADIDSWHRARGFASIGYHYVIYLDGSVHAGRDVAPQPGPFRRHTAP